MFTTLALPPLLSSSHIDSTHISPPPLLVSRLLNKIVNYLFGTGKGYQFLLSWATRLCKYNPAPSQQDTQLRPEGRHIYPGGWFILPEDTNHPGTGEDGLHPPGYLISSETTIWETWRLMNIVHSLSFPMVYTFTFRGTYCFDFKKFEVFKCKAFESCILSGINSEKLN